MKKPTKPRDNARTLRELSRAELPTVVGGITDLRQAQSTQVQASPDDPTLP